MKKKIKHRIEYILFLGFGFIVRLLPVSALHHAAALMVDILYPLLKKRRNPARVHALPKRKSNRVGAIC